MTGVPSRLNGSDICCKQADETLLHSPTQSKTEMGPDAKESDGKITISINSEEESIDLDEAEDLLFDLQAAVEAARRKNN